MDSYFHLWVGSIGLLVFLLGLAFEMELRRLMRRFFRKSNRRATTAEVRKVFGGTSPAVQKLIGALEAQLPQDAMANYKRLSPGQQALTEALVYLQYQRLAQAKAICAEAIGDPKGPSAQWLKEFMDAIDIAIQMPDTTPEAEKELRGEKARRRKVADDFRSQQIAQLQREQDH